MQKLLLLIFVDFVALKIQKPQTPETMAEQSSFLCDYSWRPWLTHCHQYISKCHNISAYAHTLVWRRMLFMSGCLLGFLPLVQVMFGTNKSVAVQDPSYPVYVDTTVMMGNTGNHNGIGFDNVEYMICTPENKFFPDLNKVSWAQEAYAILFCRRG
jgi:hypothetical protein